MLQLDSNTSNFGTASTLGTSHESSSSNSGTSSLLETRPSAAALGMLGQHLLQTHGKDTMGSATEIIDELAAKTYGQARQEVESLPDPRSRMRMATIATIAKMPSNPVGKTTANEKAMLEDAVARAKAAVAMLVGPYDVEASLKRPAEYLVPGSSIPDPNVGAVNLRERLPVQASAIARKLLQRSFRDPRGASTKHKEKSSRSGASKRAADVHAEPKRHAASSKKSSDRSSRSGSQRSPETHGHKESSSAKESPSAVAAAAVATAEESATDAEVPAPEVELPAPEAEAPASEAEDPAPEAEGPTPEAEEPAPEAEEPTPEAEEPVEASTEADEAIHSGEDSNETSNQTNATSVAPNIPNNITSYPYLKLGMDRRLYFPVLRGHLDQLRTEQTGGLAWRGTTPSAQRPLIWMHVHKEAGTFVCLAAVVNGEKVVAPSRNCNWKKYDVMWAGNCNATECSGEGEKGIGARFFKPPTCKMRLAYFTKWNFTFGSVERELHREDICPQFRYGTALRRPLLALESTVFFETKNLFTTAIKYGVEVPSGRRRFELDWFKALIHAVFDNPNPESAYGLPAWKFLDNYKIRIILGDKAFNVGPGQVGPQHLQLAIERLSKFDVVKLLDTNDEWWDGTSNELRWRRPVTAKQNFHQRESLFDEETTNYLMSLNKYDQQLYEHFLAKQSKPAVIRADSV